MKYTIIVSNKGEIFHYERNNLQETKMFVKDVSRLFEPSDRIRVVNVLNERNWSVYGWERWK